MQWITCLAVAVVALRQPRRVQRRKGSDVPLGLREACAAARGATRRSATSSTTLNRDAVEERAGARRWRRSFPHSCVAGKGKKFARAARCVRIDNSLDAPALGPVISAASIAIAQTSGRDGSNRNAPCRRATQQMVRVCWADCFNASTQLTRLPSLLFPCSHRCRYTPSC